MAVFACKNNSRPYENSMGIKPGTLAQLDTIHYTTINWLDSSKDFGTVKEGDTVYVKFRFQNTGKHPLFLTDVHPSCGCTVADYPKDVFMPGKGGEVTASFFSSTHPGFIHKTVIVSSNTSNGIKHQLSFSGQVIDSLKRNK